MARIVRREKRRRGVFGWIFLLLFWVFNAIMLLWMITAMSTVGHVASAETTDAGRAGAAIGGAIGFWFIISVWGFGDIVLGLFVLLTRGSKIIIDETRDEPASGPIVELVAVDASKRSKRDQLAHGAKLHAIEPSARSLPPSSPRLQYQELAAPVTALRTLARSAGGGLTVEATDAILGYVEAESGYAELTRRQAAEVGQWIAGLPADEDSVRAAMHSFASAIGSPDAFATTLDQIVPGEPATPLQGRWLAAIRQRAGL